MKESQIEILDCTIRDGGYYNEWDFEDHLVDEYAKKISLLGVNFIEIGYKSFPSYGFKGMYYNISTERLDQIKSHSNLKIALLVDLKNIKEEEDWIILLNDVGIHIDLLRLTYNPIQDPEEILNHIAFLKRHYSFKIALNMMYASKWTLNESIFKHLKNNQFIDYFYIVDSYGGLTPNKTSQIFDFIRKSINPSIKIGFHPHNNLELALANTIEILDKVDIIDATILGMGRGAGNLKLELLLSYLKKYKSFEIELTCLPELTSLFQPLLNRYQWGTNLPYMIAGLTSFPQSEVMDWVQTKVISLDTMVNSIANPKSNLNSGYEIAIPHLKNVLLIGGGPSVRRYLSHIKNYLKKIPETVLIFSSTKHLEAFDDLKHKRYLSIIGNEEIPPYLDSKNIILFLSSNHNIIQPHFKGERFTKCFRLPKTDLFDTKYPNHLANCANLLVNSKPEKIEIVGYDGYDSGLYYENGLYDINNEIFSKLGIHLSVDFVSLTPTSYDKLKEMSIFYK